MKKLLKWFIALLIGVKSGIIKFFKFLFLSAKEFWINNKSWLIVLITAVITGLIMYWTDATFKNDWLPVIPGLLGLIALFLFLYNKIK